MRKRGKITGLAELLADLAAERRWAAPLNRHRLFAFWDEAVGKEVSDHARPQVIRGSVLHVEVSDSVWMQQLHLQRGFLLEVLNRRLGDDGLTDIRFVLKRGPITAEPSSALPSRPQPPDPKKLAAFEKFLAGIEDEQVRASLKRIWLAQQARK